MPLLAVILSLMTSCDGKEPIVIEKEIAIGVKVSELEVREDESGTFEIYLTGSESIEQTVITLEVSVEGLENPAVEGSDFTLSTKSVTMGVGTAKVTVNPIDNDEYTGDRQFRVTLTGNSKGYPMAADRSVLVTIVDDEHPLTSFIGTYEVEALSYLAPGDYDETWTITTTGGEDPGTLLVSGIAGSTRAVAMTMDLGEMTVEIKSAQKLVDIIPEEGPYAGSIYYATDEMIDEVGQLIDPSVLAQAAGISLTGTLESDGTIKINRVAIIVDDWVTIWDVYDTVWHKQ